MNIKSALVLSALSLSSFAAASDAGLNKAVSIYSFSVGTGVDYKATSAISKILAGELVAGNLFTYSYRPQPFALEGESRTCAEFENSVEMHRVLGLLKVATAKSYLISFTEVQDCASGN